MGGTGTGCAPCGGNAGGGGAYAKISNLALTPGSSVTYQVGSAGSAGAANGGSGGNGGDTFFNLTGAATTTCAVGAMTVCARGGRGGATGQAAPGGTASASIGDTVLSGGTGRGNQGGSGGGGGGGAAGTNGTGQGGGKGEAGPGRSGGGGGGSGGGSVGGDGASNVGGNGGNNSDNSGSGTGGTSANGSSGSSGGGGGGGGSGGSGDGVAHTGGSGGAGNEWSAAGSGGGGGGGSGPSNGSGSAGTGGAGGNYGGGGGGGAGGTTNYATGGAGAQGVIVITYFGAGITFTGNVKFVYNLLVTGAFSKGAGSFAIDHPLDPKNKILYHSYVESSEVKNIYNGTVTLDQNGEARIHLPDYFDALNRDARYQWTAIGEAMPNMYVKEEEHENQFVLAGGTPGGKVSWQITGVRKDPYIQRHPIVPEVEKNGDPVPKGKCLYEPLCE